MKNKIMKLYVIGPEDDGEGIYHLVAQTGEVFYGHFCSHIGFAMGDLYANRPERIEELNKKFGKVKILNLGDDKITREKLIELNKKFYKDKKNGK